MEPESSSPSSQAPATCPYPEPTPSSPHNPFPLPEERKNYRTNLFFFGNLTLVSVSRNSQKCTFTILTDATTNQRITAPALLTFRYADNKRTSREALTPFSGSRGHVPGLLIGSVLPGKHKQSNLLVLCEACGSFERQQGQRLQHTAYLTF